MINACVIWAIAQFNEDAAKFYTVIVLLVGLLTYREQFFTGVNTAIRAIKG